MPKTSRPTTVHPVALRELEVARVADVTPGMRRVTLTGVQLGAGTSNGGHPQPAFTSPGFDDSVRLFFPYPGETEPVLPILTGGGVAMPRDRRPLGKAYSVRRWDPDAAEVDIDFVRHGIGVATSWAYRAGPGDRIHMGGPSSSRGLPERADRLLVIGDETALPAIGRLLDELPDTACGHVVVEVAERAHVQALRERPGMTVRWLVRDGADPGTTTLLPDAVRALDLPDGATFAWVAGEQATVRDVRRHLVEERGMAREDVEFTGYWRRGEVVPLAGDAAVPDPERNTTAFERFHELTELAPPLAIRVAAGLGVGDLISRGVTGVAELAARTGSDERALGKLLRYLHAIDVLDATGPGHYRLTDVGEFLAGEFWIDVLHPDGAIGRQAAGLFGLGESVRTGGAAFASVSGQDFAALRREQWYEDTLLDRVAGTAELRAGLIARSAALAGVGHVVVHSLAAGALAAAIVTAQPAVRVTLCALPAQADWLRRDLPSSVPDEGRRSRVTVVERSLFEPSPPADAVLLVEALSGLPDPDAAHALRRAAQDLGPDARVLLLEDVFDVDELDEHDAEADLLALTRDGTGLRTPGELAAVVERAGLRTREIHQLGWGSTLHELTTADAG